MARLLATPIPLHPTPDAPLRSLPKPRPDVQGPVKTPELGQDDRRRDLIPPASGSSINPAHGLVPASLTAIGRIPHEASMKSTETFIGDGGGGCVIPVKDD